VATEFDLIARLKARVAATRTDPAVLIGIGDDAAVLRPEPGKVLVTTTDTLVVGQHFESNWPAEDIGHLALAVNLSDIAAMGATSRWAMLSLTLPEASEAWLDAFLNGFLALADDSTTRLVGGNISAGPLNLGVSLIGQADPDGLVNRGGARPGDVVLVTGSLGDAAAALTMGRKAPAALVRRLRRPSPRLEAGAALASVATSMIDVSDGFMADLAHLLEGQRGAELDLAALPTSAGLLESVPDETERWQLQLGGGGDYELLFTVRPEKLEAMRRVLAPLGLPVTVVGRITERRGIVCRKTNGDVLSVNRYGWDHFVDR
jgi:thiamine-monophosphate kinase